MRRYSQIHFFKYPVEIRGILLYDKRKSIGVVNMNEKLEKLLAETEALDFHLTSDKLYALKPRLKLLAESILKTDKYNSLIDGIGIYEEEKVQGIIKLMIENYEINNMNNDIPENSKSYQSLNKKDNKEGKIFIVHGHDGELKYNVSNWLHEIGLSPIILHERANGGVTSIIQKIKENSDVDCAIILMTADDEGKAINEPNYKKRARQNVVLEAGYFIGKLGAERVIILRDEEIETPGDLGGCIYIIADRYDGWRDKVKKEFKTMGINYQE